KSTLRSLSMLRIISWVASQLSLPPIYFSLPFSSHFEKRYVTSSSRPRVFSIKAARSKQPLTSSSTCSGLQARWPSEIVNCLSLISPCISPDDSFLNRVEVSLYRIGRSRYERDLLR